MRKTAGDGAIAHPGKYSLSAKAFRTRDIPGPFFRDVAKFLLQVGCVHVNGYGMPKHKAGVVVATHEGTKVDWGTIAGAALREGIHAFQDGKKLRPIIQPYLTILFPPSTLPTPPPKPSQRRLEDLATSTWEEDNSARCSPTPPSRRGSPTPPPNTNTPREDAAEQHTSPQPKGRGSTVRTSKA